MSKEMVFGLKIVAVFVVAAFVVRWYLDYKEKKVEVPGWVSA